MPRSHPRYAPFWLLSAVFSLSLLLPPDRAEAQTFWTCVTVSVRAWSGAFECQSVLPCDEANQEPSLGTYEFSVYAGGDQSSAEIWFALDWPDDWTLVDQSFCQGAPVDGSLNDPNAGFHFVAGSCFDPTVPVASFVLQCTSPGRLRLKDVQGGEELGCVLCEGGTREPTYSRWIEIGDYCGRLPSPLCGYCSVNLAGHFELSRSTFEVPLGATYADTLHAFSFDECSDIDECQSMPEACFNGLSTDASWLHLTPIRSSGHDRVYLMEVMTEGLSFGSHRDRIWLHGGGDCCQPTCTEVELIVAQPEPILRATWGGIKSRY